MVENPRIVASMSTDELARCKELKPLFEDTLEMLSIVLLAIKADQDFDAEHRRYTARIEAEAALQSAQANASAAHAQWANAMNQCMHK